MAELSSFVPEDQRGMEINIEDDLMPVIERISAHLPPGMIWDLYASSPTETGGRIEFPYSRLDSSLMAITLRIRDILSNSSLELSEKAKAHYYEIASIQALEALMWVEIGFEGLENLAKSHASSNWRVHETVEEKLKWIEEWYYPTLRIFVHYRKEQGIVDDCFTRHHVEFLLDKFRETDSTDF